MELEGVQLLYKLYNITQTQLRLDKKFNVITIKDLNFVKWMNLLCYLSKHMAFIFSSNCQGPMPLPEGMEGRKPNGHLSDFD